MNTAVNPYSISEVSQRLDDEIPKVFTRLGYKQSFKLIDLKLLVGYSIAIIAAASFLLDKKYGHVNVRGYQTILFIAYLVLSSIFWYFKKFIESDIIYSGTKKDELIHFKSTYKEGYPIYHVAIIKKINSIEKSYQIDLNIEKMFNEFGYLQSETFYNWVKEQLENFNSKSN